MIGRRHLTADEQAQIEEWERAKKVRKFPAVAVGETTATVQTDPLIKAHIARLDAARKEAAKQNGQRAKEGKERTARRGGR